MTILGRGISMIYIRSSTLWSSFGGIKVDRALLNMDDIGFDFDDGVSFCLTCYVENSPSVRSALIHE